MPFFSIVARSASIDAAAPALVDERRERRVRCARRARASGCSAATAQNVTPMIVSARVVNTYIRPSPIGAPSASRMSCGKAKRTPSLLPIQLACIVFTRSGQPGIRSR